MKRLMHLSRCAVVLLASGLTGCFAYVNIPPQPGDVAVHDLGDATVKQVVSESLRAIVIDRSIRGPVAIVLPDGTKTRHYIRDSMDVRDLVEVWPTDVNQQVDTGPILEVKQVRVRGGSAGVDILLRDDPSQLHTQDQLATVDLQWYALHGWTAERTRFWHRKLPEPIERPNKRYNIVSQP